MALPESFLRMLNDPAPGLVFGAYDEFKIPERAHASPHGIAPRAGWLARRQLKRLTRGNPALADLVEFFTKWNGLRICTMWDDLNHRDIGAIDFLPIKWWSEQTRPYIDGDMVWAMKHCEMYKRGTWRIIARLHCEGMGLVIFFDGQHEGESLAGKMFMVGLDGLLGYEEVLAPSFSAFLEEFVANPAAWFERIGFSWHMRDPATGDWLGDVIREYVPDVRDHPALTEWPK